MGCSTCAVSLRTPARLACCCAGCMLMGLCGARHGAWACGTLNCYGKGGGKGAGDHHGIGDLVLCACYLPLFHGAAQEQPITSTLTSSHPDPHMPGMILMVRSTTLHMACMQLLHVVRAPSHACDADAP